jgi:hypothetical protein
MFSFAAAELLAGAIEEVSCKARRVAGKSGNSRFLEGVL